MLFACFLPFLLRGFGKLDRESESSLSPSDSAADSESVEKTLIRSSNGMGHTAEAMGAIWQLMAKLQPALQNYRINIQPWSKILAPLHFCQIMHHFSKKNVAITNVLVFTRLYILFALEQNKKSEEKKKKAKSDIPHRTPKMNWTKLLAP